MPRTKIRKTDRGRKDISIYEQAYKDVKEERLSIRAAAKRYELCHVSLTRYKKKIEEVLTEDENSSVRKSYKA